nr:HAMP domain-containing protein [Betaproteobacteria bacterium]
LLMSFIPLATLGVINYYQTTDIFTKSIQDFLLTIVKTKEDALESYIDATETTGQAIAETDVLQEYIAYAKKDANSQETVEFKEVEKQVENLLYSFQEAYWGKYHHIFLIDKSKKIVISPNHGKKVKGSPSSHLNEDTSGNKWAMKALLRGITGVSDYSSWVESDHSHQMLFFPVKDAFGVSQAVIGFELQIPHEEKILAENFKLGDTGKVFLTTTSGVPIVYKGIENQTPLDTPGIAEARATGFSSGLRSNVEGIDVIDLYLKHEKYPWILVAEVEAKEAFRNLYSIQTTMLIGLLVTLCIALILSVLFSNFIVNPIKRLTKQMEEVSLGNLDIKVDNMERKDEIGKLVQAFNRIVTSLKIAMKSYNKNKP